MRRFNNSFFLLLLALLGPAVCRAEMISGTVFSMDRQQNTFVLITENKEKILVNREAAGLPFHMRVGKRIRVWGTYSVDTTQFLATDIRGPGRHHGQDPTGARARLGKRRNCRMPTVPLASPDLTVQ